MISPPASGALRRYKIATLLLLLAPLSGGSGLWLIFPGLRITGASCLSCQPTVGLVTVMSASLVAQFVTGMLLFLTGVLFFVSSLGMFESKDSFRAKKWIRWMGRFRPNMDDRQMNANEINSRYRTYAMAALLVIFVQDILLVPPIGEDRLYALNQFSTLITGPVLYFYTITILLSSLIFVFYKRPGGYVLGIVVSLIAFGITGPDFLGLLPPSAPTLRTAILMSSILPVAFLLAYVSWKEFRYEVVDC